MRNGWMSVNHLTKRNTTKDANFGLGPQCILMSVIEFRFKPKQVETGRETKIIQNDHKKMIKSTKGDRN